MHGHVLANVSVANVEQYAPRLAIGLPSASTMLGNSHYQGEYIAAQKQVRLISSIPRR